MISFGLFPVLEHVISLGAGLRADLAFPTCDLRPATCDLRPATCDLRPATCDLRPATCDLLIMRAAFTLSST
jgi:hypothetical protein